jgi:hypothetical protein
LHGKLLNQRIGDTDRRKESGTHERTNLSLLIHFEFFGL